MISDIFLAIIGLAVQLLTAPFLLIPTASLPNGLVNAITNVQGYWISLKPIFPMVTLLAVISFMITVEIAIFAYKGIMWVIKKFPGIS